MAATARWAGVPGAVRVAWVLAGIILAAGGCTYTNWGDLHAPAGLAATQGELDRIVVSWRPVSRAGIYYVYRASLLAGEYAYHGFSATTSYVDLEVSPEVHYFYGVTAADLRGQRETPLGEPAEGWSSHEYAWSAAQTIASPAGQLVLASEEGGERVWALVTDSAPDGPLTVLERADGQWSEVADAFGSVDGEGLQTAALALYQEVPYAAYADLAAGGKVTVRTLSAGEWAVVGTAGFTDAPPLAQVGIGVSVQGIWVAYLDQAGALAVWRYHESSGWAGVSAPTTATVGNLCLVMRVGTPILGFEEQPAAGASLRFASWDGTAWVPLLPGLDAGDISGGHLALAAGAAAGEWWVAFVDGGGALRVHRGADGAWGEDLVAGALLPYPAGDSLGLCVTAGSVPALFFRDAQTYAGLLYRYQGGSWTMPGEAGEGFTVTPGIGLSSLGLEAAGNILVTAYLEGTAARSRAFE